MNFSSFFKLGGSRKTKRSRGNRRSRRRNGTSNRRGGGGEGKLGQARQHQ